MGCNHEKLRCTDNRFFCLICGQEIQMPTEEKSEPEKTVKKTARKKAEKENGQ